MTCRDKSFPKIDEFNVVCERIAGCAVEFRMHRERTSLEPKLSRPATGQFRICHDYAARLL